MDTIRNPVEWTIDQLRHAAEAARSTRRSILGTEAGADTLLPAVRRIAVADLRDALASGLDDFRAFRTDVVFLCVVYPVIGILLSSFAFRQDLLPLLFPLVSGFALVGPVAAIGLYELSRRREQGIPATWADAFSRIGSPAFGAIVVLGLGLLVIFLLWLGAAQVIYMATLGPEPPASLGAFISDLLTTGAGWALIIIGMGIGFLFALLVLMISVVSFPMLLDRDVGVGVAVITSVRAVVDNPRPMATWGLIVAGGLMIGSLPLVLGLIFVMPVLGHATWHLYRKVVPR
jgi:uncharacterized membrane protein